MSALEADAVAAPRSLDSLDPPDSLGSLGSLGSLEPPDSLASLGGALESFGSIDPLVPTDRTPEADAVHRPVSDLRGLQVAVLTEVGRGTSELTSLLLAEGAAVRVSDSAADLHGRGPGWADLLIVDLVPGANIAAAVHEARRGAPVVVALAPDDEEASIVAALDAGADDAVGRPVRPNELLARLRNVSRRLHSREWGRGVDEGGTDSLDVGPVRLDLLRHEAFVHGREVHLAPKEFAVLRLLLEHPGELVRRERIVATAWGRDHVGGTKTLDVHIMRLRTKVEPDPSHPVHLITVRGIGFRFEP